MWWISLCWYHVTRNAPNQTLILHRLTVGTLLSGSSPLVPSVHPAAAAFTLQTRTFDSGFRKTAQSRWGVIPVIIHPWTGHGCPKATHGGVPGTVAQGFPGSPSMDRLRMSLMPCGVPAWRLSVDVGGAELVEGVGNGVLAHRGLDVWGELVQAVVEEEGP